MFCVSIACIEKRMKKYQKKKSQKEFDMIGVIVVAAILRSCMQCNIRTVRRRDGHGLLSTIHNNNYKLMGPWIFYLIFYCFRLAQGPVVHQEKCRLIISVFAGNFKSLCDYAKIC